MAAMLWSRTIALLSASKKIFFLYQPPTWQTKNCFRDLLMSETFVYSRGSFLMTNMSQKPAFLNMPGLKSMKAMFDSKI